MKATRQKKTKAMAAAVPAMWGAESVGRITIVDSPASTGMPMKMPLAL